MPIDIPMKIYLIESISSVKKSGTLYLSYILVENFQEKTALRFIVLFENKSKWKEKWTFKILRNLLFEFMILII
jgi:hypothetical protein